MTKTKLKIDAAEEIEEETLLIDGEMDNLAHSMLIAIQSIYKNSKCLYKLKKKKLLTWCQII
jgi:hypothetical protein